MKGRTAFAALIATLAMSAGASAKTVHCPAPDQAVGDLAGKNIVPLGSRFGGKQGGCWVATWVATEAEDHLNAINALPAHFKLRVAPRDATRSETWHYSLDQLSLDSAASWVVARSGRQVVKFSLWAFEG